MKMKHLFAVCSVLALGILFGCQSSTDDSTEKKGDKESFTYTRYDLPLEGHLFLGEPEAKNEIVLAFDYACKYCKQWMNEVLPVIEEDLLSEGDVKYTSKSMTLLSVQSLYLTNVDYLIKTHHPEQYFEVQRRFAADNQEESVKDWGSVKYVKGVLKEFGIDPSVLKKDVPDQVRETRNYTRNLGVEFVPTVYVNGIKVQNAFDVEEIKAVLEGDIKEGDIVPLEQ